MTFYTFEQYRIHLHGFSGFVLIKMLIQPNLKFFLKKIQLSHSMETQRFSAQRTPQSYTTMAARILDEIGSALCTTPKTPLRCKLRTWPAGGQLSPGGSRHRESWTSGSQTVAARRDETHVVGTALEHAAGWWQEGGGHHTITATTTANHTAEESTPSNDTQYL